ADLRRGDARRRPLPDHLAVGVEGGGEDHAVRIRAHLGGALERGHEDPGERHRGREPEHHLDDGEQGSLGSSDHWGASALIRRTYGTAQTATTTIDSTATVAPVLMSNCVNAV